MATGEPYINDETSTYLTDFIWQRDDLLLRLEQEALVEKIPIIQIESIQLLSQLVQIKQAKSILEIGTAIGYSTIWLARAQPNAQVLSLEIDERMVKRARANISEASLADRVTVLHRDATTALPEPYTEKRFDFIFMDASKQKYEQYLERYLPLLEPNGVLAIDNVLFHGLVYRRPTERRQAWIAEQLNQFNHKLFHHPQLVTSMYPIGDGLSISIKKVGAL